MSVKKITKIISVLLIILTIFSAFSVVLAGASIPEPIDPGTQDISKIAGYVIFVVQIIAFTAAVIMLIFLGIKFLTASPEAKAEIKKSSVIYVVGAIMLFAATGILQIIKNLAVNVSAS